MRQLVVRVSASPCANAAIVLPSMNCSISARCCGVAGMGDRAAGEHRAAEERLDHQAAAQRLEDHGDVEAAAAEAAVVFAEQRADHAQFGELAP